MCSQALLCRSAAHAVAGGLGRGCARGVSCRGLWTSADPRGRQSTLTEVECAFGGALSSSTIAPWASLASRPGAPGETRSGVSKTEFEHVSDLAAARHLPRPGPGGFARGCFIGWRRADRYGISRSWAIEELYERVAKVGEGGFGTVHSARHRRTGEVVAIKTLPKERVRDEEALRLEVKFLKLSDHPNVVRYYESFEDEGHLYLVMEMCTGAALSEHIKAAHECHGLGFTEQDVARIMMQMLRGVAYCHSHSIVHRDIKPHNFLFGCGAPSRHSAIPLSCSGDADAPLKLVDFGISGVVRCDKPSKRLLTKRAGTEGFMAPEVNLSLPYGPSADVFSLGAVMHTAIAGQSPRWDSHKNAYNFPGRVRWRQLSPEGQAFLGRLASPDPSERPTASDAVQDPWFGAMGISVPQDVTALYRACVRSIREFSRRSKLQRSIMYSMVAFAPLHNHHMERLRTAFLTANTGASGGITRGEFDAVTRCHSHRHGAISYSMRAEDTQTLFSAVNSSQTGQISYSEWLAAAAPQAWYDKHDYCRRAFETLDVGRNGFIRADDLCRLLPGVFHPQEIADEIRCLNPSGDGRLTFKDFCALSRHVGRSQTPLPPQAAPEAEAALQCL